MAADDVVVDEPGGLHERVDGGGAHEAQAVRLELAAEGGRLRGDGGDLVRRGRSGRTRGSDACAQIMRSRAPSPCSSTRDRTARALPDAARIFARLRMIPASPMSRSTSSSSMAATASMSKPWKTSRKRGRLRRMVIHDSPAWKPSRHSFSNSGRSPCSGRPHSSSWYLRYSGSAADQAQRAMPSSPTASEGLVTTAPSPRAPAAGPSWRPRRPR